MEPGRAEKIVRILAPLDQKTLLILATGLWIASVDKGVVEADRLEEAVNKAKFQARIL